MGIDLPPPVAPLPFAELQIRAYGEAEDVRAYDFAGSRIHIAGGLQIAEALVDAALASALTPSDAVRAVAMAYYRAGYPAAQVFYTRLGRDLHLLVVPGRVESVAGPAGLHRYFGNLTGQDVLRAADLEPARALASVHAERSGRHLRLRLDPGSGPGLFRLGMEDATTADSPSRPRLHLRAGNPGNRFVGRDFIDAEITLGGGGAELRVQRRQSLDGERIYREHAGSVGLVSTYGMFAVEGRRADYTQSSAGSSPEGRVSSVTVGWSGLPYADFETRWVAGVRATASRDVVATALSTPLLEQSYIAAQISLARATCIDAERWPLEWQLAAMADIGLDGRFADAASGPLPRANFLSLRPSLSLALRPASLAQWTLGADLQAQFARQTLPRQQQWVLGGDQTLAAWLPGVIVADRGYLLRLHAGRPYTVSGWTLRPRWFAEAGGGHLDHGDAGTSNADVLVDTGMELGIEREHLTARLVAATPLQEPDDRKPERDALRADLFFQVSLAF